MTAAAYSPATPGRLRPPVALLGGIVVASILGLTGLVIVEAPASAMLAPQLVLIVCFGWLAVLDLKWAVAIAMVELAVAGASGQWTRLPGGFSGRIVLDAIVAAVAAAIIVREWRSTGRWDLGRYAPHAIVLALVIPIVWMAIGLVNGNQPRDVVADGNAHFFFAFTLAFVVLLRRGLGAWVRHWLFVSCSANALFTFALVAVSVPGIVPLEPTLQEILGDRLLIGDGVGYQPNGAYRLFLASGLYLQLGLAIVTWRLLRRPRSVLDWALLAILGVDIIATYTRGFWVGAAVAMFVVLALGGRGWRDRAVVLGGTTALFVAGTIAAVPFSFSLPDYVLQRSSSIVSTDPGESDPTDPSTADGDATGALSNQIRVEQARVLLGQIRERPIFGYGFGTIAQDYSYRRTYTYELAYLDLLYKTGLVGTALFLSYPLRLLADAMRGRIGRLRLPTGVPDAEVSIPASIIVSILITGATNPYFLGAYGLMPILATIAWLDPLGGPKTRDHT
jgi:O-antigen ligase